VAAIPALAAAVSNAGALGTGGLAAAVGVMGCDYGPLRSSNTR
jgi:hypothetical protein